MRSVSSKSQSGGSATHETQWSEADYEKHFVNDLDDNISQPDNGAQLSGGDGELSDTESDLSGGGGGGDDGGGVDKDDDDYDDDDPPETPYVPNIEEEFGDVRVELKSLDNHLLSIFTILLLGWRTS